jgi:hypothetical protein
MALCKNYSTIRGLVSKHAYWHAGGGFCERIIETKISRFEALDFGQNLLKIEQLRAHDHCAKMTCTSRGSRLQIMHTSLQVVALSGSTLPMGAF